MSDTQKTTLGWFPGHMHKARKELKEGLKYLDVIIEVADARAPFASLNPFLQGLCEGKPRITLFNKKDLADLHKLKQALSTWGHPYLLGEAKSKGVITPLLALAKKLAPHRGTSLSPLRLGVVGIPNVGKSTLINTLAGRKIAKVGDIPALTRGMQKVNISPEIQLIDSPGILMPETDTHLNMIFLSAIGCIGARAMDEGHVVLDLLPELAKQYPEALVSRYGLTEALSDNSEELLTLIARRIGAIKGDKIYPEKASQRLIQDLRTGKLGKVTFL